MIKFVADSSCDFREFPGVNFVSVPLTMSTSERSFRDDANLDITEMLDYMAAYKGRSYTACPSVDAWMEAYSGADEVYAITITSGLSGSYNSAMAAKELFLQSHPEVKLHVFDSLSTGPELRLLMEKLVELTSQGLPFETVVEKGIEYQKHTRVFFIMQSLHNLSQNGRVNKVVAATVGVLGIRIVGTASAEGTLESLAKSRGDNKALPELSAQLKKVGCAGTKIRITHAENPALAQRIYDMLKAEYPDADLTVAPSGGLCSYYAERGSTMIAVEIV